MYVRAVSTRSNGTLMASWVWFTNLNLWNCPQKSSALLHVPSKMVGGTPRIPPFKGGFGPGAVVVTFTDIVSCCGGSRGSDPCRLTTGLSVAASASSRGPGAGTIVSRGSSTAGPQVSDWWFSGSDSEEVGDGARYSVRLVVKI